MIKRQNGYTLLELVVVMTIVLVLLSIAAPVAVGVRASYVRLGVQEQLAADLMRAQSEARAKGARVIVAVPPSGDGYTVGFDYIPYQDPAQAEDIRFNRLLPAEITLSPEQTIIFDSRGYLVDQQGDLTAAAFALSHNQLVYAAGTISPIGRLQFD